MTENMKEEKKVKGCVGSVQITLSGKDAKSVKTVGEGTGADEVVKEGNGFVATFPLDQALVKSSREDGICSYGAELEFNAGKVESAIVQLSNCEPEMLKVLERLTARTSHHLEKIGVQVSVDEEDGKAQVLCDGEVEKLKDVPPYTLAVLQTSVGVLLIARAHKALSYTEHPLTYFDLAQAMGVVEGLKKGHEPAIRLKDMLDKVLVVEKVKKPKKAVGEGNPKPGKKPAPNPQAAPKQASESKPQAAPKQKPKPAVGKKQPKPIQQAKVEVEAQETEADPQ